MHDLVWVDSNHALSGVAGSDLKSRGEKSKKDRPAQSLEPPWGRASRLQRCSGSAATEQDLCKTVTATNEVNSAKTSDCVPKRTIVYRAWGGCRTENSNKPGRERFGGLICCSRRPGQSPRRLAGRWRSPCRGPA